MWEEVIAMSCMSVMQLPAFFVWGQQSCNQSAHGPSKQACIVNGWLCHVFKFAECIALH